MANRSDSIRVLHVLEAVGGGTLRSLHLQMIGIDRKRFSVAAAIPPPSTFDAVRRNEFADLTFGDRMRDQGFEIHLVPMVGGRVAPARNFVAALKLAQILRSHPFDIIHTHSAIGGLVGRLAAKLAGARNVIYQPNGLPFHDYMSPLRRGLYIRIERTFGRFTTAFVASSNSELEQARAARVISPNRASVVENPIDTENYRYDPDDATACRQDLGLQPGSLLVGTAARMVPQKGLPYLIDAAALVVREVPSVWFAIAGDGRLRDQLRAQAARLGILDRILLLGQRSDITAVVSAFDVFVMPSLWEGLPYAPIEAMLLGRPIVATTVTGLVDIVPSSHEGLLVPPRDSQALAAAILKLLREPELRFQLAAQGEASVRRRFDSSQTMGKMMKLYEGLTARSPAQAGVPVS